MSETSSGGSGAGPFMSNTASSGGGVGSTSHINVPSYNPPVTAETLQAQTERQLSEVRIQLEKAVEQRATLAARISVLRDEEKVLARAVNAFKGKNAG